MRNFFYNITSGNPSALLVPSLASFFDGLGKIIPAALIFDVVNTMYLFFAHPGTPLNTGRLWTVCVILLVWMLLQYLVSAWAYSQTYTAAYAVSAQGRIALAEHLRRLSLGFLGSRDPGDLTTMMLGDYAAVELTISHYVAQLISASALPVIAFIGFSFINWKMALAMFIALPLAILIVWLSAGLQEYLLGMREIKSHNLSGERFERLREAFARLMRESIKIEGVVGPIMMAAIALVRAGLTLMIFVGSYLLVGGELTLPVFLMFLVLGNMVFEPLTGVLINYAEIRYSVLSAERIMQIRREEPLAGTENPPPGNHIEFDHVTFAYEDAPIVLLDEATASLDPENENQVQRAINALVSNKTVVMLKMLLHICLTMIQFLRGNACTE